MKTLWAPWRAAYVSGVTEAAGGCSFFMKPARGPDRGREDLVEGLVVMPSRRRRRAASRERARRS